MQASVDFDEGIGEFYTCIACEKGADRRKNTIFIQASVDFDADIACKNGVSPPKRLILIR